MKTFCLVKFRGIRGLRSILQSRNYTPTKNFTNWPSWHSRGGQTSSQSPPNPLTNYIKTWRENPLPIGAGFAMIGFLQWRRLRKKDPKENEESKEFVDLEKHSTGKQMNPVLRWGYSVLPLNGFSRLFGFMMNGLELPVYFRKPIIGLYVKTFGCDLTECQIENLEDYPTLGHFFRRKLKEGVRPIQKAPLTSPCDGRVLACGPVNPDGQIEQIKGVTYPLKDFLGQLPMPKTGNKLFQVTLYLAPGDYHGFHSPADWNLKLRRHFPGKLYSVSPSVVGKLPSLFNKNERVVYSGEWGGNFFSFAAVGATNVGSIVIDCDKDLKTNLKKLKHVKCAEANMKNVSCQKGSYFGEFNMGSTIVLVFEAPESFDIAVKSGQKVKVGQSLMS